MNVKIDMQKTEHRSFDYRATAQSRQARGCNHTLGLENRTSEEEEER